MPKAAPGAPLHRVAIELGYITIYWAWLEDIVDELITVLAPLERDHPADAILGNSDIRQKAQMIRALALIRKGDHTDWYDGVVETINAIDNDLRVRRNQHVHAAWYSPKGQLTRQKKSVRVTKSQSYQPLVLSTKTSEPIKIGSVQKLRKDLLHAVKIVTYQTAFALRFDEVTSRGISYEQFLRQAVFAVRRTRAPQRRQRLQKLQLQKA